MTRAIVAHRCQLLGFKLVLPSSHIAARPNLKGTRLADYVEVCTHPARNKKRKLLARAVDNSCNSMGALLLERDGGSTHQNPTAYMLSGDETLSTQVENWRSKSLGAASWSQSS